VKEINSKYNLSLPESDNYNSLGGMIMNFNNKMPKNSDVIKISNYEITILKSSSNRINLISLSLS
jgi:CBS domain containing-hemolysin-like protein